MIIEEEIAHALLLLSEDAAPPWAAAPDEIKVTVFRAKGARPFRATAYRIGRNATGREATIGYREATREFDADDLRRLRVLRLTSIDAFVRELRAEVAALVERVCPRPPPKGYRKFRKEARHRRR